jgi:hypothetical protein
MKPHVLRRLHAASIAKITTCVLGGFGEGAAACRFCLLPTSFVMMKTATAKQVERYVIKVPYGRTLLGLLWAESF